MGETAVVTNACDRGREAFERSSWREACEQLLVADAEDPLLVEDLERLAVAAYLAGRDEDSVEAWTRAHHASARLGDTARAAPRRVLAGLRSVEQG